MSAVLEIQGLSHAFGARRVLEGLDLSIEAGEFVALLGRSGSGKSTVLRLLAGLDAPGEVARLRLPPAPAVVFQEPRLMPWKTAEQNVALGLRVPDARRAARAALAEVGLQGREEAWPATLSGGEAQRVALARALVREPPLLLLDEPFAALDALTRLKMHALVGDLWRGHGPAVLLVTHDVWEAVSLAQRVLVLENGRIGYQVRVDAPYPRRRDNAALAAIETDLLARLGVGQNADTIVA